MWTSVKGAVLQAFQDHGPRRPIRRRAIRWPERPRSGWAASDRRMFVGAPWVISVDDHVDPWRVGEGDAPRRLDLRAASSSPARFRRARRRRRRAHLANLPAPALRGALAATAGDVPPSVFRAGRGPRSGTGTRVAANGSRPGQGRCAKANSEQLARRAGNRANRPAHQRQGPPGGRGGR